MHKDKGTIESVQSSAHNPSSAEQREIELEQLAALVQSKTPVRRLVRWVAGIRASVHTKLLAGFLVVALLFIVMAAVSLQTIATRTGLSKSSVQAALRHLRRRGLVDDESPATTTRVIRTIRRPWLRP